jgi:pimeloyl-ACP methyl ester carboxylesterase
MSAPDTSAREGLTDDSSIPVLFVHGQPGLGSDFAPVAERLERGFAAIMPDRPGYGDNPAAVTSMSENVEWLAGLLDASAPAVVVGHSYGGGLAILLAQRHPDLVAGLVLAASIGSVEHLGTLDRLLALRYVGDALVAGGLGAAGSILPLVRARTRSVPGRFGRFMEASLPDSQFAKVSPPLGQVWRSVVKEQRSLFLEMPLVEAATHTIAVPVEVIAGSWDVIVPPAVAVKTAASIPDSELLLVSRTGHFLTRDAPDVLATAVRRVAKRAGRHLIAEP